MEPTCPICQGEMKLVPAGVSKRTGKPYASFWGCKTWECKGTVRIPTDTQKPQEGGKSYATERPAYDPMPKKDIKTTMDYKARQISGFQDDKQESMRLFSSGRDAVLVVTEFYKNDTMSDEQIKSKIKEWRDYFYKDIYHMGEDEYKSLNVPF